MIRPYQEAIQSESSHQNLADVVLLRQALGIKSDDAEATVALEFAVNTASRMIENYVNQRLIERTVRFWYKSYEDDELLIPARPIHSYTVIDALDNATIHAGSLTKSGILYLLYPPREVIVEVDTGYLGAGDPGFNVPPDLQEAVIEIARTIHLRRSRSDEVSSETMSGVVSTTYTSPRSIPFHVQDILDAHRLISI